MALFAKMEKSRQRISTIVKDPATAEALKPYYNYLCKRPCFSDEYLQTFNRGHVTLVDTAGKGVERITPTGINPDGRVNAASLAYDLAFYREQGLIKGALDLGDVIDGSFVEAVFKELGPYRP